jgi:hypothetical protein
MTRLEEVSERLYQKLKESLADDAKVSLMQHREEGQRT